MTWATESEKVVFGALVVRVDVLSVTIDPAEIARETGLAPDEVLSVLARFDGDGRACVEVLPAAPLLRIWLRQDGLGGLTAADVVEAVSAWRLVLLAAVDLVASGGMDGVTEVVAGFYALMDQKHGAQFPSLQHAAKLLATVITHPEPGIAWVDTGQKATSIDPGLPVVDGVPGATLMRMSAEHGGLALEGDAQGMFDIGDKLWLVPSDIGNSANVYDYIHVARDGKLEAIWEVAARGQYR